MRKTMALKMLLRAPLQTILTFMLIAAASFTLFSRVADYVITGRETANAEGFYHGVAALDNTVPNMNVIQYTETGGIASQSSVEDKQWPTKEQLEEFSSLPGVTMADTRYMTAGLVEDFKRLTDKEDHSGFKNGRFVLEGTYIGYEYDLNAAMMDLEFDEVKVLAGDMEVDLEEPVKISATTEDYESIGGDRNPYPPSYFDELEKGSRCLVVGSYNDLTGREPEMNRGETDFCVLDGFKEDYLETEEFAYYKGLIDAINQSLLTYDIVYTSDMRSIPCLNEESMVVTRGRALSAEDTEACVVSEYFLDTYGLSLGNKINIELGDRLFAQNGLRGATARDAESLSGFIDSAELEIVGAYRFVNDANARILEGRWNYTPSTIFVSGSLLPVEVPADHEATLGEFSVFVENARDIETFRDAAEPFAAKLNVALRFSDGGWLSMKDSFETGTLASFLTTVLYIVGAVLALLLAVFLYAGRHKTVYAIMRTLGVPGRQAGDSFVLPLGILSMVAIPSGGIAGLIYTSKTAAKTLLDMAESAPYGYVLNTTLPVGVVILCLLFELAFTLTVTLLFLSKLKKTPPLELLQEGTLRAGAGTKGEPDPAEAFSVPIQLDIVKLSSVSEMERILNRKYSAFRHVTAYILRHMRRSVGKTAVSLIMAVTLAAGVGMFVLARLTYQDAFFKVDVKGKALDFSSSSIDKLSDSGLMDNFYCYGGFSVRTNSLEFHTPMTLTNDIDRYLADDYNITYAEGYDLADLDGAGNICLIGQALAEGLGIRPGDEIDLLSDALYSALLNLYKDREELLTETVQKSTQRYKVIGIVESDDAKTGIGIFASVNTAVESIYGQPFPFGYCEFTVADNERIDEVNSLLDEEKQSGRRYAPMASFYVDATGLDNIRRICGLLEAIFPIAVTAAALIGLFGSGLVILQSAKEAAFLRVLGVAKKRARCMLVFEQIILCFVGIVLVTGGLALYSPGIFARSTQMLAVCYVLYFMGCVCGASAAAVQVTRHRILELLQVKE